MFSQDHIFLSRATAIIVWTWVQGETGARKHWGYVERRKAKKGTAREQTCLPDVVSFRDEGLWVASLLCMQLIYSPSNISAKPLARLSLCSLKLWVAWGGQGHTSVHYLLMFIQKSCILEEATLLIWSRSSPILLAHLRELRAPGQSWPGAWTESLLLPQWCGQYSQAATQSCWILT